jgi:hypothetical protein
VDTYQTSGVINEALCPNALVDENGCIFRMVRLMKGLALNFLDFVEMTIWGSFMAIGSGACALLVSKCALIDL